MLKHKGRLPFPPSDVWLLGASFEKCNIKYRDTRTCGRAVIVAY